MKDKALKYLTENSLLHMGMIFPIKRGTVEIIYADADGVFLIETVSGAYMLSAKCPEKSKKLLDSVGRQDLICVHQKSSFDYLTEKYNYPNGLICLQAVYNSKEPVILDSQRLNIRQLTPSYIDIVYEHYHENADYDYIKKRLAAGDIYGGFLCGELCGFAGTHAEGCIGILEVFPAHRRNGFAFELEAYMVNLILENGQIPFAQVTVGNEASMRLHKKLGFDISVDEVYWMF